MRAPIQLPSLQCLAHVQSDCTWDAAATHLPLEGGGRPAPAGREGVTALQHSPYQGGDHPTPDCLRQSDPPPPGEGGHTPPPEEGGHIPRLQQVLAWLTVGVLAARCLPSPPLAQAPYPSRFGSSPESFGAMIAAEIPKWAEAVRAAGLRLD